MGLALPANCAQQIPPTESQRRVRLLLPQVWQHAHIYPFYRSWSPLLRPRARASRLHSHSVCAWDQQAPSRRHLGRQQGRVRERACMSMARRNQCRCPRLHPGSACQLLSSTLRVLISVISYDDPPLFHISRVRHSYTSTVGGVPDSSIDPHNGQCEYHNWALCNVTNLRFPAPCRRLRLHISLRLLHSRLLLCTREQSLHSAQWTRKSIPCSGDFLPDVGTVIAIDNHVKRKGRLSVERADADHVRECVARADVQTSSVIRRE